MGELSVNHLLGIKYLKPEDIQLIFETADHFKEVINRPIKKVPSLRDYTIANVFFENSTRTKLSFELAQKRLSADIINFAASSSSVNKGETLIDTINNILAMKVDMIVMRHPSVGAALFLSQQVNCTIINAGDGNFFAIQCPRVFKFKSKRATRPPRRRDFCFVTPQSRFVDAQTKPAI
jgi:aspartate carbamoyltransferase catalytic subunit